MKLEPPFERCMGQLREGRDHAAISRPGDSICKSIVVGRAMFEDPREALEASARGQWEVVG